MGRRRAALAGLSLALLAASACGGEAGAPLEAGAAAPAFWADDGTGRPVLAWVFRGDDYLGCRTAAADVRRVRRRIGSAVRLSLVYVGEDPAWVGPFVRRERLDGEVTALGGAEARRVIPGVELPAFVAVRGGVVARVAPSAPDPAGGPDRGLEAVVRALRAGPASWSGAVR